MAQLPTYKSTIQQSTSSVAPALQGIAAAQAGGQALQQSLTDKLGSFFKASEAIAEPILAGKAEATALKDIREGTEGQKGIFEAYGSTAYRDSYNKRVQQLAVKTAQNDLKVKYDNLERDYFDNPVQYEKMSVKYRDEYVNGLPDFAKTDAYVYSEALSVAGKDRVANNHLKKMRDIETSETNVNLMNMHNDASNAAYNADETMMYYMQDQYAQKIDQQIEDNLISFEEGRRRKETLNVSLRENNYVGKMDRFIGEGSLAEASKYLSEFEVDTFDTFGTAERDRIAAKMRGNLNSAVKQSKAHDKDTVDFANNIVSTAIKIRKNGKQVDNPIELAQALQASSDSKKYEWMIQSKAADIVSGYNYMSLPEQRQALTEIQSKTTVSGVELEVMLALDKNLKERETKAKSDPISLGGEEGLYAPTAPLQIKDGPQAWGAILSERGTQSTINEQEFGKGRNQLFSDIEATQFTDWLNSGSTSVNEKIEFVTTIESAVPSKAMQAYSQLSKKGASIFAMAGSLVRENKVETAKQILSGQTILKEFGNVEGIEEVKIKLFDEIGNAMAYSSPGDRKMLKDSSLALYMYKAEQEGDLEKGLTSRNTKSVITELTNGIDKRNGQSFFLPKSTSRDDFEDYMDELTVNDFQNVGGVTAEQAVKIAQDGQLVSIGTGGYRIKYKNGWMQNKDGSPFVLRY
jgi:hypothetical protein